MHLALQVPAGQSYTHLAYGTHDVIAAGLERTIHLIDASSGALLQVVEDAHTQLVYLQWSPVPRRIGGRSAPRTHCSMALMFNHFTQPGCSPRIRDVTSLCRMHW